MSTRFLRLATATGSTTGLWVQLTPETSPPARVGPAVAYAGVRGEVVLFGGVRPRRGFWIVQ
jgi:hypothetical protein